MDPTTLRYAQVDVRFTQNLQLHSRGPESLHVRLLLVLVTCRQ